MEAFLVELFYDLGLLFFAAGLAVANECILH